MANLRQFFLEFGKHFTFVGDEYRITVGDDDYKVDLLFYHRLLRCFVAVELKIGGFKPEYIGKMQFYLAALDEKIKLKEENPFIPAQAGISTKEPINSHIKNSVKIA